VEVLMAVAETHEKPPYRFKMHWHVILTHFPLSLFSVAFLFQVLHLFRAPYCFELATNVALIGATISMVPVVWTGWRTWKKSYRGAMVMVFQRKIIIAIAILAISVPLVVWRSIFLGLFTRAPRDYTHWVYLAGNTLLIAGAFLEGFYGGRLNHR
jgi:uncharacterized membrane protein